MVGKMIFIYFAFFQKRCLWRNTWVCSFVLVRIAMPSIWHLLALFDSINNEKGSPNERNTIAFLIQSVVRCTSHESLVCVCVSVRWNVNSTMTCNEMNSYW